ncbi:MAG TPA: cob(I)yrinic acid a,c-diamide adenosyltransferase [Firmicutes bacterium]|nr:cob(I)yrinic acid a,c-diamide adenosyltransferase [Candidatus Fermentithermobacillaceae bacterium]
MADANKGLIMVYTGDGKGKTTAALGLALRQIGWGKKVLFLQFMKGQGNVYGERIAAEKYLPLLRIEQCGRDEYVDLSDPDSMDRELAQKALERAAQAIESAEYGLVVLDEVCVAMACGLVSTGQVLDLLADMPEGTDLVLTGRYCPQKILEAADMVSEVKEVKHHYTQGIAAREGIEF